MKLLEEAKEKEAGEENKEGGAIFVKDPVKEGANEDKRRKFMT